MNPLILPFDLTLARDHHWPLVTRDKRKAEALKWDARGEDKPLAGFVHLPEEDDFTRWYSSGQWAMQSTGYDLFLSSGFSDPAVRRAIQSAHAAGEAISAFWRGGNSRWGVTLAPQWLWSDVDYCPTRLLPVPQPLIAPGYNQAKLTVEQVGTGYRLREEGETVQEGDDYFGDACPHWCETNGGGRRVVGTNAFPWCETNEGGRRVVGTNAFPYRTKVQTHEALLEWLRPAELFMPGAVRQEWEKVKSTLQDK